MLKRVRGIRLSAKDAVVVAIVVALLLFLAGTLWWTSRLTSLGPDADPTLQLEYLKWALEIYKSIGLGFLVTLLVAVIPTVFAERKYDFAILKAGRKAYSVAKTRIDWLALDLLQLDYAACKKHLQETQRLKHEADTYMSSLSELTWPPSYKNDPFLIIESYLNEVERNGLKWDSQTREERFKHLKNLPGIHRGLNERLYDSKSDLGDAG